MPSFALTILSCPGPLAEQNPEMMASCLSSPMLHTLKVEILPKEQKGWAQPELENAARVTPSLCSQWHSWLTLLSPLPRLPYAYHWLLYAVLGTALERTFWGSDASLFVHRQRDFRQVT